MLVLGEKYEFTKLELDRLRRKFPQISFVKYASRSSREVRLEIEALLKANSYKYLVINTSAAVDAKMIKFLTLLQFRFRLRRIKIITIEKFLEKCYIPQDDHDLKFLSDIKPYNAFEYLMKRAIDYIDASVLLALNFGIKFYVAKKIAEQSPGEIYFKQKRVGLNNREFYCIKFRSIKLDAEKDGAKFASKDDDRVFAFGSFMRKTRIDEIPQCINILRGEMHLIGPRAKWDILVRNYEKEIPYYNERHLVRPGITGWT